jgi:DNA-binding LacI/PurR family transcriptional regulator
MLTNGIKIKDIAKIANVSIATVSLVLNNKPGVSDDTRQKILQITKSLVSSPQNQFLFNDGSPKAIRFLKIIRHGHVLNHDHNVFIASYLDGLEAEARLKGYNLEVTTLDSTDSAAILSALSHPNLQGLIVLGTELTEDDMNAFESITIPMVFIDTEYEHLPFNFVDMNNMEAAYQIIKHLIDNGHTHIGMIKTTVETGNFRLREQGFYSALQYFKIPLNRSYIFEVDSTFDGAYQNMLQLLKKNSSLPTALFSSNDIIAYGCIKAFKEFGLQVPEDISIIGFDDLPLSALMEPPLTTMRISKKQIGKMAMKLLLEKVESQSTVSSKIIIGSELVIRNSVKSLIKKNSPFAP